MSNRPVRSKYLKPKMKIILCIFLLYITAVSVFGEPQELNGVKEQSVEFPAAVKKGGFLMYRGVTIGDSSLRPPGKEKYKGRLQWDSSTGFFSLSGLRLNDSGEYKVQNTDQKITVFQLNVHKDNVPVSKPHVIVTRNEYRCTILCTVDKGTRATLYWYREGEKESYGSSPVESAPHLYLPLFVERSGTYTCKAKNSVSNETSDPLTVGAHCTAPSTPSTPTSSSTWIIVASVIAAVVVLIAVFFAVQYYRVTREIQGWGFQGFRRGIQGDAVQPVPQSGNRSKHPTKDGDAVQPVPQSGETRLELSPDARRKLIQVDKLLNDSLPAYDKKFLNEDLPAYDEEEQ